MDCVADVVFLSGLAPPLGLCRGGDLCGLYSASSQDGKVVEYIPLVVWGLCFGKVGVISCLFGPVRGYHQMGPQCLLTPPVPASSIYAAILCGVGGLGSVCYIWSTSPFSSCVLYEFKYALSNSLFLSLGGPEP